MLKCMTVEVPFMSQPFFVAAVSRPSITPTLPLFRLPCTSAAAAATAKWWPVAGQWSQAESYELNVRGVVSAEK